MFLARPEAGVQRRRQHFGGNRFFNRSLDRPAAFAGILYKTAVFGERRILGQRHRRQIEQPRTDHAAAPPDFRDVGQVQIVADFFRQVFAGRVLENVEALGIGLHHAVLDAVVHHLHEVPGAGGAAVDVAVFRGAAHFLAARSAGDVAAARSQRLEDRIETR